MIKVGSIIKFKHALLFNNQVYVVISIDPRYPDLVCFVTDLTSDGYDFWNRSRFEVISE